MKKDYLKSFKKELQILKNYRLGQKRTTQAFIINTYRAKAYEVPEMFAKLMQKKHRALLIEKSLKDLFKDASARECEIFKKCIVGNLTYSEAFNDPKGKQTSEIVRKMWGIYSCIKMLNMIK